jgi:hypothetical protein
MTELFKTGHKKNLFIFLAESITTTDFAKLAMLFPLGRLLANPGFSSINIFSGKFHFLGQLNTLV